MKQPNFPKWYPVDVDDEIDLGGDESPYGDPQLDVMPCRLPPRVMM
jgi:hypothetical protein